MEDDLGARGGDRGADRRGVGDVPAVAAREAADLGAQRLQPQRQPAALEAGVAGDQDPPPGPERGVGHGARHGRTLCDDPRVATLRILGAGGWIPTATHATCSALLRSGDAAVLIDAGTGIERLVADRSLLEGVETLDLVLTHFHLDHVVGLGYMPGLRGAGGCPPRIWGPARGGVRRLDRRGAAARLHAAVRRRRLRAGRARGAGAGGRRAAGRPVHGHRPPPGGPQHADAGAALRRPLHLLHGHALRRGQRRAGPRLARAAARGVGDRGRAGADGDPLLRPRGRRAWRPRRASSGSCSSTCTR